jgi:hypothetical protein
MVASPPAKSQQGPPYGVKAASGQKAVFPLVSADIRDFLKGLLKSSLQIGGGYEGKASVRRNLRSRFHSR